MDARAGRGLRGGLTAAGRAATLGLALGLMLAAGGCAGSKPAGERQGVAPMVAVQPADEVERKVLGDLAKWPAGECRDFAGVKVVAAAPYEAASGRRCRRVSFAGEAKAGAREMLACAEGERWFFVPEVFAGNGSKG